MKKKTTNKEKQDVAVNSKSVNDPVDPKAAQKIIVINKATPWLETVILLFVFLFSLDKVEWYWEILKYFTGTLLVIHTLTLVFTIFGQMKHGDKMPDYLNPDNYKKA